MNLQQRLVVAAKAAVGIFSENSMRAAYGLLSGIMPGGMGQPPVRGTADYLRAYSQMPWLRAVTSRVATATASAEWQLFVVKGKKDAKARGGPLVKQLQRADRKSRIRMFKQLAEAEELQQVTEHQMLDVLRDANEFQTGFSARKVTQLHLDLVGDAFWLKERDALGVVVAVWPIPPSWIIATPTPAYRYFRVSFRGWRGPIPDTEFVWFSDVDPLNPYGRGSGAAMALGDELDTDEYAARHSRAFFYNSARPDLIISPKGPVGLRDENVRRLEEDWLSKTQGFFRSFKPYFLSREVEVKELDQNFRAMQFTQLREFERDVIMQHYGIPPEILGVLTSSNRATIESADYFMSRYVVDPRLEFQRTVLQERFAPEYDERLIVEYVSTIQEDKEYRLEVAKAAPFALTVNEWRKMTGHGPLEDEEAGELHAVPTTYHLQPIEKYEAPPTPPPFGGQLPPGGRPGTMVDEDTEPEATEPGEGRRAIALRGVQVGWKAELGDEIAAAAMAEDSELADFLSQTLKEDGEELPGASAVAYAHESGVQRTLLRTWKSHAQRIDLGRLARALASDNVSAAASAVDIATLGEAQTAALLPHLSKAAKAGVDVGLSALRSHGIDVRPSKATMVMDLAGVNALATQWAQERAASLVQADAEVREYIRLLAAEANESGVTVDQLARTVRDVIGLRPDQVRAVSALQARLMKQGLSPATVARRVERYAAAQLRSRALTIARTETISMLTRGQQLLWEQAANQGAIRRDQFVQEWIVTPDDRLDTKVCEALDSAQAPLGGLFEPGGFGGPPAHPRCRCAVGLVPSKAKAFSATIGRDDEGRLVLHERREA